jgi:1-deoxy-D-xylulose-5-phosphate reductoisomerase
MESGVKPLDLAAIGQLSFEPPDLQRFPCLGLAYAALRAGGTAPAILNAANEVAVDAFLHGRLGFTSIARVIEEVLGRLAVGEADTLERVLGADRSARACAAQCVESRMERAA